jgi:hypothetical protein
MYPREAKKVQIAIVECQNQIKNIRKHQNNQRKLDMIGNDCGSFV